ncbi:polyketide cyclase [Sphingobium sp. GW456-12-10-14-TSB1]|nr:polyketide cyclase [Sphingobium sp.]MBU0823228.1 SRPBCC family protein [Alphaproteobacteria bacterium]MBU0869025.1 SRPBCC family protein [Alphaproteobacteria bacterium]MBU1824626.1 SRPBCC family protein [Alphaproteobacteria bacterium]OUC56721.1 polyketide cyclase [Sphingobium sp. GW456-12-10-14-TSB1]
MLPAAAVAVFARLDDQTRLAAHMEKPSAMMGGGRMTYAFDANRGMAVGSLIHMGGSAFGLTMAVDEVVTERTPPYRKVWRTVGTPQLVIVGGYEMGIRIANAPGGCELTVWIDYWLPRGWLGALLGRLLGGFYARWCVGRMVADAATAFSSPTGAPSAA